MNTPLLLLIYNRPDHVEEALRSLRKIRPKKLFIAGDGPKSPEDAVGVDSARNCLKNIDWPCSVQTLFRDKNLGCQQGVSQAITWFFSQVESGIILEDDCLVDSSFFSFASELLEKYKDDSRTSLISAVNFQGKTPISESYFLSEYSNIWGWASWANRWQSYDSFAKNGQKVLDKPEVQAMLREKKIPEAFIKNVQRALSGELDSWAYIWSMTNILERRFSIVPKYNLVHNAGFGKNSTHTKIKTADAYLEAHSLGKVKPSAMPTIRPDYEKLNRRKHQRVFALLSIILTIIKQSKFIKIARS